MATVGGSSGQDWVWLGVFNLDRVSLELYSSVSELVSVVDKESVAV